ncbi:MAG: hypothetical protein MRK00_02850 [Nitrosomonas sp.]|nr:hypothetical protein [Nitrosomonas sp.]
MSIIQNVAGSLLVKSLTDTSLRDAYWDLMYIYKFGLPEIPVPEIKGPFPPEPQPDPSPIELSVPNSLLKHDPDPQPAVFGDPDPQPNISLVENELFDNFSQDVQLIGLINTIDFIG